MTLLSQLHCYLSFHSIHNTKFSKLIDVRHSRYGAALRHRNIRNIIFLCPPVTILFQPPCCFAKVLTRRHHGCHNSKYWGSTRSTSKGEIICVWFLISGIHLYISYLGISCEVCGCSRGSG